MRAGACAGALAVGVVASITSSPRYRRTRTLLPGRRTGLTITFHADCDVDILEITELMVL